MVTVQTGEAGDIKRDEDVISFFSEAFLLERLCTRS